MKKFHFFVGCSVFVVALVSCGKIQNASPEKNANEGASSQEVWNSQNNPLNLSGNFVTSLKKLPLSASLETKPWTDTYWPTFKGGVAHRWRTSSTGAGYKLNNLQELRKMSEGEIQNLSPAEKYDIFVGDYAYPLTNSEKERTAGEHETWEGICHGWAPASYMYLEPEPIEVTNKDGIKIRFGSSDIKALLSLHQGNFANARARILGARCNSSFKTDPASASRKECSDTNAGAFHVVITNQIALAKKSFVADVTRDLEVWNQPVHSYESEILNYQDPSAGSAVGTVREAVVVTNMTYTLEVQPQFFKLNNTSGYNQRTLQYKYVLELNDKDEIIGGEWISDNRPDFLWTQERGSFTGYFSQLSKLAKPAN